MASKKCIRLIVTKPRKALHKTYRCLTASCEPTSFSTKHLYVPLCDELVAGMCRLPSGNNRISENYV